MKVNFCGPINSRSGYGQLSRYMISALNKAGQEISVEAIQLDPENIDFGPKAALVKKLTRKIDADINVINMIPPLFGKFVKPNRINVGFTMWEASKLPNSWVKDCNEMDAILVPCTWNEDVFKRSGVTVPIYVVQPGIEADDIPEVSSVRSDENKEYKFYSIFQWTERKNPSGLIKAFLSTFVNRENVSLTLKTYRHSRLQDDQKWIENEIAKIKKDLNIPAELYAKINIVSSSLSSDEMGRLHRENDCFVLPSRAEGWGLPFMEAMSYGNPTIGTNYSGNTDFMTSANSFLVPFTQTPVCGMSWYVPWFDGTMSWSEPDLGDFSYRMKWAYKYREAAREKGLLGRQDIINKFTSENSARQFLDAAFKVKKERI